jgi:hypothetical protein
MQFSQAECPQCSRRGLRKPRGCSGSESYIMPDLILHAFECSIRKYKYHKTPTGKQIKFSDPYERNIWDK